MFIANLCLSGLTMTLFCIPPTFMQIIYGGWWHLGLVACKLVPAIQGKVDGERDRSIGGS